MHKLKLTPIAIGLAVAALSGCTTMQTKDGQASGNDYRNLETELKAKEATIAEKDQLIQSYRDQLGASPDGKQPGGSSDLLPPNAKPGECYARLWVPAKYRTVNKKITVQEASEKVTVTPAKYDWVEEKVVVQEASTQVKTIPAVYTYKKEQVLLKEASRTWKTGLGRGATPVSDQMLAAANQYGVDLDAAKPGMCYHEHYRPAEYSTEDKKVEVSPASVRLAASSAQYRTVEKKVLVKEASYEVREIPAQYDWVEEKVIDKPAHTVWKKGTGPIQKIDEATGEIMCLVEVPASYKVIRKQVIKTPARSQRIEIPAQYKTVKVRELVSPASEVKTDVAAQYETVKVKKQVSPTTYVWHEIHDMHEPSSTRTGAKICLTEEPAQYKEVTRKVVKVPAQTKTINIPAKYKMVKVRKQVSEPQEIRTPVPATYKTVSSQELEMDGHMEWRSILCETNMTKNRISSIQKALKAAGYNPGPADGVIGSQMIQAVNAFQRAKGLPVDKYINLATLKALGVSAK